MKSSDIINSSTLTSEAAKQLIEYVNKWLDSPQRALQIKSQEYYDGTQEIQNKIRGYTDTYNNFHQYPSCIPNTRIVHNLYRKIVDQKVEFISERKLRFISGTAPPIDYSDPKSVKKEGTGDIDPTGGYKIEGAEGEEKGDTKNNSDTKDQNNSDTKDRNNSDTKYQKTSDAEGVESPSDVKLLTRETTKEQDRCSEFLRLLENLFDRRWYRNFHEALNYCLIDGDCWLYPYIDSDGDFSYRFFRGSDICPVYVDESYNKLAAIVRVYDVQLPTATGKKRRFIEVYRKENMIRYEIEKTDDGSIFRVVTENVFGYITATTGKPAVENVASSSTTYKWSEFPFIHISASTTPQPLLSRCQSLLDAINTIYSNWCDSALTYPDGGILVVQNYGGENPDNLWSEIVNRRFINVMATPETPGGDAHYLETPAITTDYNTLLASLHKALFEVCCAFDETDEMVFKSNLRELVIRTAMLSMEQDANTLIASIEEALHTFVYKFFCPYLTLRGFEDYSTLSTEIKVDDIRIRNIAELTNLMVSLGMRMSNRTMLEHHPWITDVDEEQDRIMQEQNMQQLRTQSNQPQGNVGGGAERSSPGGFGVDKGGTVNTGSPKGGGKPNDFVKAAERKDKKASQNFDDAKPQR